MSDLQERLDRAERALTRAGYTLIEGAQEWKPPIGPSASPLLYRIDLLTFLLRELRDGVEGEWCFLGNLDERIDAALAGKLSERPDTAWDDAVALTKTAADYRELQAQHDQLQSKYKAALNALSSAVKTAEFEGHAHRPWHDSAKTLLAGQVPVLSPHQSLLDWAVTSWHEQVAHRPMENVYRRTLDSVWRQVIRFAGEDPQSIIGPSHDDLLHAAAPKPEGVA